MSLAAIQSTRLDERLKRELGPSVLAALEDPDVIEIILNPDGTLWVESHRGGMRPAGARMPAVQAERLIGTVAFALNTVANDHRPVIECELPLDGSRFTGWLPPVVSSPSFVIRKHTRLIYTLDDYRASGIINANQAEEFRGAVARRENIVLAGGTGSGKTTLANALLHEMVRLGNSNERFIIIEDTLELHCDAPNVMQLHTTAAADLTFLTRTTMRARPDRIIIGEVRGAEALALLKAWNTGHPGGVTTVHANSASAALTRLGSLVQEARVPPQPDLIAQTVNLLAFITRTPRGRRVTETVRVEGYDPASGFKLSSIGGRHEVDHQ
ncbi:MAG: P-type conjugative transfer ATPase TrbB [Candidatus Binataceae bacterium]|nr:P-type conjugative transfer ATPase TrbB [Candidatus Binataceae bacterium]